MKPDFALSLSFEGIVLLQRASALGGPETGWYRLGEVALTVEDLSSALGELRRAGQSESGDVDPEVKLVLPQEQVRMLQVPAPTDGQDPAELVEAALDGATPYRVSELAYDYAIADGQMHIVAVARETLVEAESFALDHNFVPLSFVTVPPDGTPFPREPFLGPSKTALTALTPGVRVTPDIAPVAEVARPAEPEVTPDPAPTPAPPAPEPEPEPKEVAETQEPQLAPPSAEATKEPSAPSQDAKSEALPHDASQKDNETVTEKAPAPAEPAAPAPKGGKKPAAKTAKAPAKPPAKPNAKGKQQDNTAPKPAPKAKPLPSPADLPKAAKPAPKAAPVAAADSAPSPGFASIRARRDTPSGSAAPLSASRGTIEPPARPVPPPERRLSLNEAKPDGDAQAEAIAATAAASLTERPPAPAPETPEPAVVASESTGQKAASLAGAAMARASTGLGKGIGFVSRRTAARKDAAADTPSDSGSRLRLRPTLGLGKGGRKGAASAIAAENMMQERDRLTVFGARQPQKVGGKPPFLGLILTVVLLVFLLGVAAWASVFLEGGLANLFGRRETPVVASANPEIEQETLNESAETGGTTLPDTALSLPDIDAPDVGEDITVASLSEGVPALSDALVEEQLDGLSVPFEAETLTPEQAEARYAATGIWQRAPAPPEEPLQGILADLYVASIDPSISQGDAIAIPTAREATTDLPAREQRNPLPPDAGFEFTDEGLIKPTPEGVVTPDGYTLVEGSPPLKPPTRPAETLGDLAPAPAAPEAPGEIAAIGPKARPDTPTPADPAAETSPVVVDPTLAGSRPRSRPDDLIESNERANLGGISLRELAAKRPRVRPAVSQEKAQGEADETATEFAVASSIKPTRRPAGFARLVDRARKNAENEVVRTASAAVVAPRTVKPRIPSSTSVTKAATVKNAINLRKVNLIGVYGKPSARRALVRLSNGRYKKVKVGDRIDGGRVAAIGEDQLRYTKSGRNVVLKMPRG